MAKAIDIARFFILLGASEDEPDLLSHLRLQKLLYYAQGWSLALRKQPLFLDRIEAWPHGPVVKSVYQEFARFGKDPIPASAADDAEAIEEDEAELVGSVWEHLKEYSASGLRDMTHREPPWVDARKGLGEAERSDKEITREAISAYFATLVEG
jgi:uncharacterized phage-associated protein